MSEAQLSEDLKGNRYIWIIFYFSLQVKSNVNAKSKDIFYSIILILYPSIIAFSVTPNMEKRPLHPENEITVTLIENLNYHIKDRGRSSIRSHLRKNG